MENRPLTYNIFSEQLPLHAEHLLKLMLKRGLTYSDDTGAYVAVYDITDPKEPILVTLLLVGYISSAEKRAKYMRLACEKCERLATHTDHISSAQSSNEKKERYAGAARGMPARRFVPEIAIGTSGLLAAADEAMSAMLLHKCHQADDAHLAKIAQVSSNNILQQLF